MSLVCKTCGADADSPRALQDHYRTAHPEQAGQRGKRGKTRARAAADAAPEPSPRKPAPEREPLELDLDDERGKPQETAPDLGADAVEPAPAAKARGLMSRLWGDRERAPKEPKPKGPGRPRTRRTSAEPILRGGWGLVGAGLIRTGVDIPVGRALQYQAPIAGEVLDRFLAGGWLDRVALQPLATRSDELELVAALFGFPLAIAAYERAPDEIRVVLEPVIVELVRLHISAMAPVLAKRRKREQELERTLDEMKAAGVIDDELGGVDEVVSAIVNGLFAREPAPEPEPEPAAAV